MATALRHGERRPGAGLLTDAVIAEAKQAAEDAAVEAAYRWDVFWTALKQDRPVATLRCLMNYWLYTDGVARRLARGVHPLAVSKQEINLEEEG